MNDSQMPSPAGQQAAPAEQAPAANGESSDSNAETPANGVRLRDRLRALVGLGAGRSLRDNLESALRDDTGGGTTFSPEERVLLRNILHLREVRLDDIMVPRADIDAVDETVSLGELVKLFRESGHSRMPVYTDTLDDPRGLVHIKDVMAYITNPAHQSAGEDDAPKNGGVSLSIDRIEFSTQLRDTGLIRPVLFVPPSMPATDLMATMQAKRMQMALVIDEYGGTDGLVSLEDLVETVVGDIVDEHDEDEAPMITTVAEGIWHADARLDLEDATAAIGENFAVADMNEDVDTLGGLLFSLIGRVPVRGELISSPQLPGYEIEVLDADPRRIKRLRIYQKRADGRHAEGRRAPRRSKPEESAPEQAGKPAD